MTVPKLNQKKLREIPIPLPPLEEQKRIVSVLDQAFAALDRARANAEASLADVSNLGAVFLDDQIFSLFERFGHVRSDRVAHVKGGERLPKGEKTTAVKTGCRSCAG